MEEREAPPPKRRSKAERIELFVGSDFGTLLPFGGAENHNAKKGGVLSPLPLLEWWWCKPLLLVWGGGAFSQSHPTGWRCPLSTSSLLLVVVVLSSPLLGGGALPVSSFRLVLRSLRLPGWCCFHFPPLGGSLPLPGWSFPFSIKEAYCVLK